MKRPGGALPAYGLLGMPLAMVALPVYIQVPQYYSTVLALPLATTGIVLFAARIIDTVQDPWLGRLADRSMQRGSLAQLLWITAIALIVLFAGLWLVPVETPIALALWLAGALAGVYTLHSFLTISYLAWGARLSNDPATLVQASAWREAAGLAGVVLASALPVWLIETGDSPRLAMAGYTLVFAVLLLAFLGLLLWRAPRWQRNHQASQPVSLCQSLALPGLGKVLLPYFLNALSVSIPATLALFFINDHIGSPALAGVFLGAYFISGALALPLWSALATRWGPVATWRLGMLIASAGFVWAIFLEHGDILPYLMICVMAGAALGADLAMPPVILAHLIPDQHDPAAYYGLWSLLGKCALALSGLTLPLLALTGYEPGGNTDTQALALVYAGLPCVFKLLAWFSLGKFSLPVRSSTLKVIT